MKRVLAGLSLLIAASLAMVLAGCGGGSSNSTTSAATSASTPVAAEAPADGRNLTIAMITHGDGGSFWSVAKKGAEQAAKDMGVKLVYNESDNDPQKQAQMIDAAISQKVDGLAVSAPNPDAIKGALAKATAAGIPIITLNSGADVYQELGAVTHVGQDEVVAGRAAGEKLKAAGATKVLCLIHEQSNIGLTQRCQGVKDGFGGNVENLQVKGSADISTTQTEIKSKLQADKSFDAVMALNPDIATAAATAIKGANSAAKLATFDQSADVIKGVLDGSILFAVDQQQYLQGYLPVVFLTLYKDNLNTVGGGQPVLTGPGFIDQSNAGAVEKLATAGTR